MAKTVVIDEIHVTLRVPNDLLKARVDKTRTTLVGEDFMNRLRRVVRAALPSCSRTCDCPRVADPVKQKRVSVRAVPDRPRWAIGDGTDVTNPQGPSGVRVLFFRRQPPRMPAAGG